MKRRVEREEGGVHDRRRVCVMNCITRSVNSPVYSVALSTGISQALVMLR